MYTSKPMYRARKYLVNMGPVRLREFLSRQMFQEISRNFLNALFYKKKCLRYLSIKGSAEVCFKIMQQHRL